MNYQKATMISNLKKISSDDITLQLHDHKESRECLKKKKKEKDKNTKYKESLFSIYINKWKTELILEGKPGSTKDTTDINSESLQNRENKENISYMVEDSFKKEVNN
ncbi:STP1 protein [Plasmodium brasilianum]|uniref:STP1 protein n=1 Tax=Plasmodium brasilianum TaxID=5824 RepID=A0ACB9YEE6_PLABR|nr:STP1 protein [Plasmodium brasilianum]